MNIIRTRIGNMIYFHQPTDEPFDPQEDRSYLAVNLSEGACTVSIEEGYVTRNDLLELLLILLDGSNLLLEEADG